MKVTKYPQSCLIIEKDGKRIIIDPGSLVSPKYRAEDLFPAEAILITHEHADHADPALIDDLTRGGQMIVVGNQSTSKAFGGIVTKVVSDGEKFEIAGFSITARELPHVAMVDGSAGPQNTGYLIDDVFFHSGDGIKIDNLTVNAVAAPIAGPDISPRDVFSFVKSLGCDTVIPVHYDYFSADPNFFAKLLAPVKPGIKIIVLADEQSVEL
ncbi:MAG TPA: MBL fold metallo-hydrolase [Patescibacteria group bacterium]|jgi:L-ascorbate metabolism protein UlaG (beta-lactamase superfamily)|nr:MBL fold metallo-hydrolase [Patescibacteria group bacterium]